MKRLLLVSVAFVAMLPTTALARGRVGVFVGPAFAPYGWYGWYGPYYGMYPYGPPFGVPNAGEVKLDTKVKDAEVFIDGSYAGTVGQLKTMTMRSGNYSIEIRAPGRTPFEQKIHVVAGKTMKLRPDLGVQPPSAPTGS
jgi:opacity protein-like surface antigen